ncbi:MAG: release factor glutamine methyltransferase [Leptospiraceae bacterium]|nr:MAG: release factor glutamine methyltransferase [Leptospiraceae bacterium]
MNIELQKLWKNIEKKLNHIENPRKESLYILKLFLGIDEKDLLLNKKIYLSLNDLKELYRITNKRNQYIPLAYLFQKKEFYSMEFYVNPDVLIPRPETEQLVDLFLKIIKNKKNLSCLDIGTGSGCIPISILYYSDNIKYFLAIDISKKAIEVANKNKKTLLNKDKQQLLEIQQLDFIHDIKTISNKEFDFIVSNPPYVLPDEYKQLDKELFYEPEIALIVNNPYDFYYKFFKNCLDILHKSGSIILESSPTLIPLQIKIIKELGYKAHEVYKDYQNLDRFLVIKK